MANSRLATYRNITQNQSGKRNAPITAITPHYMASRWTGRQCADYFANTERQASSNYCVGINGDIAVSVDEDCRAWTSANAYNDNRAITIECANNPDSSLPKATYKALIVLCADICTRYGITPHYDGTIYGSITMHKQFSSTSCPGQWLTQKITSGQFERDIKAKMNNKPTETPAKLGKYHAVNGYIVITYRGADGVVRHSKPSWSESTEKKAPSKLGDVIKVVGKQMVDGHLMYKLFNSEWITGDGHYVNYFTNIHEAQALKNALLKAKSKKSTLLIAQEVINGKWGNGATRIARLKKAGYNPDEIQKKVNELLR